MPSSADSGAKPELRAALLEAATRHFLKQPYEAVRVDDVVADAGVAKGLAFYHFKSKRGLYIAVVQSLMMSLVASTQPDASLPPRAREIAAVEGFIDWASRTEGVEIILSTWSAGDAEIDRVFRETAEHIIGQMLGAMGDMPGGPGREDELPTAVLRRAIWGWLAFTRIVTADWLRQRDMERDQLRDLLVGSLDGVVASARKAV